MRPPWQQATRFDQAKRSGSDPNACGKRAAVSGSLRAKGAIISERETERDRSSREGGIGTSKAEKDNFCAVADRH
jgi:hypothetical protein